MPLSQKKRKAEIDQVSTSTSCKRSRESEESEKGNREWPASSIAIRRAEAFLRRCAAAKATTLIVPDKDADGLCGGSIIYRTLVLLGHNPADIQVHIVSKGSNVHDEEERKTMTATGAEFVIIVDQGSRPGPVLWEPQSAAVLIIDHHWSEEFPDGAEVLSACKYEPVATSALLSYILCMRVHPSVKDSCDWLACMGTIGDLGTSFRWDPPFPNMQAAFKKHTKKSLNDAVSLVNAPRRTAAYDVISAWNAIKNASSSSDILSSRSPYISRLLDARDEVNAEVERCTHTPPQFSADGKVALLRIQSKAQVHPVIAKRWAGHLKSKTLEIVMVANSGYLPGLVNFSCRIAKIAYARMNEGAAEPNIIELLQSYADRYVPLPGEPSFRELVGDNFARGHKQASGGIIKTELFEEFCRLMEIGVKRDSPKKHSKQIQSNTLDNYFSSPKKS
ncbi:hypothetical protein FRC03_008044 [Tulasnella sp. 419]|nr:hypothetical protein FRC03_008044 [Tulasnella sp. 419]